MVFLSLVLKPAVNRWTNIIAAALYFASILLGCVGETWVFYIFGSIIECILLLLAIRYAWIWPKQQSDL